MALMTYREANQVLWRGVRPAHNGTQNPLLASADNGTVVIGGRTVGLTYYLCSASMGFAGVLAGIATLYLRSPGPVTEYRIFRSQYVAANNHSTEQATFWPPFEVPDDWDIVLTSSAAGFVVYGHCFGWEE